MNSSKITWLFLFGILLVGCAAPKTIEQQAATADFGPPPANSLVTVKNYFSKSTYDPSSLVIQGPSQPYKAYAFDPAFIPQGQNFGWGIKATVSAKDKMGYPIAPKNYVLFYRNGTVYNAFEVIPPQMADGFVRPMP